MPITHAGEARAVSRSRDSTGTDEVVFLIISLVFLHFPPPALPPPIQTQEYTNQGTMCCC